MEFELVRVRFSVKSIVKAVDKGVLLTRPGIEDIKELWNWRRML